jgi:two-component system chemotaxis sensor kinase CheA
MEEKINSHIHALQEQAKTIEEYNQTLEAQIAQRTKSLQESHTQITALLNNSGQGFLSCEKSLHVRPEYSKECEILLGDEIAQNYLPHLLYKDQESQNRFEKTLSLYFEAVDELQKEAYLSLLDSQTRLNGRDISIEYKPLDKNTLMLILTDISKVCTLESKLQEERDLLNFITMALKDKRQFFDALEAYKGEMQALQNQIDSGEKMDTKKLQTVYRKIHTYKGVFLQYALPNLPKALHLLEENLAARLEQKNKTSPLEKSYFHQTQSALKKDIDLLAHYLGEDFIAQKEAFSISLQQYDSLETLINKMQMQIGKNHPLSLEIKELLESLRLVPFRTLLGAYPQLAFQLALHMGKEIEHFQIEGGDFLVDPHRYGDFAKAMIHLFNNAIDHGIESPIEREELGKSPVGLLRCTITQTPGFFHIQLSDDGKGLDGQIIRKKAQERGLKIDPNCSENELFLLIFEDGFSLKESITQISGRGVGLSALKAETLALGGSLEVTSFLGYGSTFSFSIPFNQQGKNNEN